MDPTGSLSKGFSALSVGDQNTPHDDKDTTPSLTRVSPKRDLFTDEDHNKLDAYVIKTFSLNRRYNEQPPLDALLTYITVEDKRLVTLSSEDAQELLDSHPSVGVVLQKAWRENNFKEVRQLEVLWPVVPVVQETPAKWNFQHTNLAKTALESAWNLGYSGENHRLLFANINHIRMEKPYSNQIAIVQSSGTGKSRMVHEQASLVFTIPFNLRESDANRDLAYPIPDDAIRDHLVPTIFSNDQPILTTRYLRFLRCVFRQINDELEQCKELLRQANIQTAEDLARWWSKHLKGRRKELYQAMIDGSREAISIFPDIQDELSDTSLNDIEFAAAEAAKTALAELIKKLNGWSGKARVKLILYFDEAHTLTLQRTSTKNDNDNDKTPYDVLSSSLNQFLGYPVFFVFLSTNSSLAHFAPPQALARSARIRRGEAAINAPITETPFDCYKDLKVKQGELNLKEISSLPFMAKFGRPLFWTLLRGAGKSAPQLHADILELARAKLVASRYIDAKLNDISRTAKLAVMDLQLSLDFEPRREKVQLDEATLVESHMRIAYSVPAHREYLRSGYPSEPLLAEAAAQQLSMWRKQDPYVVVHTLTDMLGNGLLNRGELGELTGRQLLLDAYHRAVEHEHAHRRTVEQEHAHPDSPNFSAGCHLTTFIRMLYVDGCADEVLKCTPDTDGKGMSFGDAFKNAIICFTHFGKMSDDTGATSTAAWAAFIRHMAIICRNHQRKVDCILPVLLWDTRLCEHVMTAILVQFKRRIQPGTVAAYSIDEANINFFPKNSEQCTHGSISKAYRPYVSLVMELGVQPKISEGARTATEYKGRSLSKQGRPSTPPNSGGPYHATPSKMVIPKAGTTHHPKERNTRYEIFAYGCSPSVYRGIDEPRKASYALLLSSRDFLGEHPRQDVKTLQAVRRMKPFWSGGDDSYHWVEENNILHGPLPPPEVGFHAGEQT